MKAVTKLALLACTMLPVLACDQAGGISRRGGSLVSIEVDTSKRFQTISAWEATAQSGDGTRAFELYRDTLFTRAIRDLGITRLRIEVRSGLEKSRAWFAASSKAGSPSDRCARYFTENDNPDPRRIEWNGFHFAGLDSVMRRVFLPLREIGARHGVKVGMNLNYVAFMAQCPSSAAYHHEDPEEYAEFILAASLYLRDKYDVVPDLWEVILEPENTRGYWTGQQIGRAIVATAKRLEAAGFTPRFIAPSTTKAANAPRYFDELLGVPGAQQYLAELSYHRYGGVNRTDLREIAERGRKAGLNTAMLERIGSGVDALHDDLTLGMVSSWQQYVLAYPSKDNGAQYFVIEDETAATPRVLLSTRARYLRQYFRYVRPGAVRIHARSDDADVAPVGFINSDGKIAIVLKCEGAAEIEIKGLPPRDYDASYTTEAEANARMSLTRLPNGLRLRMPGRGVITVFVR